MTMNVLLWGILALLVGLAGIWVAARRVAPRREPLPPGVELPATPLQRVSAWSLGVGLVLTLGAATVLLAYGAEATYAQDALRTVFTLLVLAPVVLLGGVTIWLRRKAGRESTLLDERDRAILDRAPGIQGGAAILTLAVWTVGLVERFHEAGAVPLFYLFLVFWSCIVVYVLGLPLGILAGYRRS
jgi:hypothetical protein